MEDNNSVQHVTNYPVSVINRYLSQHTLPNGASLSLDNVIPTLVDEQGFAFNLLNHYIITSESRESINILGTELSQGRRAIMIIKAFDVVFMVVISPIQDEATSAYLRCSIHIQDIGNHPRYIASINEAIKFLHALMVQLKEEKAQLVSLGPQAEDPEPT